LTVFWQNANFIDQESSMRPFARYNVKTITVTQYSQDFESILRRRRKTAAFEAWRLQLNPKDRLPRGPFFRGKTAGKPNLGMIDEFWSAFSSDQGIAS